MLMIPTITLWQPWASLMGLDKKRIETRSWHTTYRGPLAIHAAKNSPPYAETLANLDKAFNQALTGKEEWNPGIFSTLPFGAVICIGNLVDCLAIHEDGLYEMIPDGEMHNIRWKYPLPKDNERAFGDYTPGRFAWMLKDVKRLDQPIAAKGSQKIWKWDATEHQVAIDPWVVGDTKIWTPRGIVSGRRVEGGTEDAVMGLEVAA